MATKPLPATAIAVDPLLQAIARALVGAPETAEERAAIEAAIVESKAGGGGVDHEVILRKITDARP